ncbi:MAG: acylphosphatase [Elusimicrobia bacterium]|nr:acylphosphatase [Elusimicrobiota bacterium]MBD3411507.1 acylphosphatase [Elusimicrobiota bacterium]
MNTQPHTTHERRFYAVCKGQVQGVGFRFFVRSEAEKQGITGWVRNLPDGSVEMEIEGKEAVIKTFLNTVKTGHPWARVDSLNYESKPSHKAYNDFFIKYD